MHGIIFSKFQEFATSRFGDGAFPAILREAGLGSRNYESTSSYPDGEIVSLVGAASKTFDRSVPDLLEEFGIFLAPGLLAIYRYLIQPEWRTLDVLEHVEETVHWVVRLRQPAATPPLLSCERVKPNEVVIVYRSERRMCPLAKGLSKGVAKHYGESIEITEPTCMLRGASHCRLSVRTV